MIPKLLLLVLTLALTFVTHAQKNTIKAVQLGEYIYLLKDTADASSNAVLFSGNSGVILVDAPRFDRQPGLIDSLKTLKFWPVKWLINTSWHPDHTGGNPEVKLSGGRIMAYEAALKRMQGSQAPSTTQENTDRALPDSLIKRSVIFRAGNEKIIVHYPGPAHTDGDLIVKFDNANVIHAGDIVLGGMYAYPEIASGGQAEGLTAALSWIISHSNDKTIIVPGHGPLLSRSDVVVYRTLLSDIADRVRKAKQGGKTLEQVKALKLTGSYDSRWGSTVPAGDRLVEMIYLGLKP